MYYFEIADTDKQHLTESICNWFLNKFALQFEVELSIISRSLKSDGVVGWMLPLDDNEYEIEIEENLQHNEFITTLIHELIHVWQYTLGYQCEDEAYKLETIFSKEYITASNTVKLT